MAAIAQSPVPVITALSKSQWVKEITAVGTLDPTKTVEFASVQFDLAPKLQTESYKTKGRRFTTALSTNKESSEVTFDGVATYEELDQFCPTLASALSASFDSYTIFAGNHNCAGSVLNSLSLKGKAGGSTTISGSFLSMWPIAGTATALSPAAANPILAQQTVIGIGTPTVDTITRWFSWELAASDLVSQVWMGGGDYPLLPEAYAPPLSSKATFSIVLEANTTNLLLLDQVGIPQLISILATSTTDPVQTITITALGVLESVDPFSDNEGVYAYGLKFDIITDGANGIVMAYDDGAPA
ncbi:MAG: hypothetical protein IMZ62_13515 [Chloroflexi bacterium]|nr:hypothetical protein [Chloroflexota bacterium]